MGAGLLLLGSEIGGFLPYYLLFFRTSAIIKSNRFILSRIRPIPIAHHS